MVHYRLVILQYDGATKVSAVKFDEVDTALYHADLLSKSAGIESVTVEECRPYLTLQRPEWWKEVTDAIVG
jgi:hypothetical protein